MFNVVVEVPAVSVSTSEATVSNVTNTVLSASPSMLPK